MHVKTLLFSFSLFFSINLSAQIQVGPKEIATLNKPGKLNASTMEAFKKTTTLFTLQYKDYQDVAAFEKAIAAVWTITPFRIIKPDEINAYLQKGGYSIFTFGGYLVERTGSTTTQSNMHIAYDLWLPGVKSKPTTNKTLLARILVYPDSETFFAANGGLSLKINSRSERVMSHIYNEAVIYSWSPGFLKGYLKTVNDGLAAGSERGRYTEEANAASLSRLKNDTLYLPEYLYVRFNKLTGREKKVPIDKEEVKKAYPYPVRFISTHALSQMILNQEKPIRYLIYIKSSTDKFLNIYDSGSGELIFSKYMKLSYNFNIKDLSHVARAINK